MITTLAQSPSLTQALSQLGDLSVNLIELGESSDFSDFQDFRLPEKVFSRRVVLCLDGIAVLAAQSVCLSDSHWRMLLNCGNTPLGQILFSGSLKGLQRSPMQYRLPERGLLSRRSWFDYQHERLYLVETFLPAILRFQAA